MADQSYITLIIACFFAGVILGIIEQSKTPKYKVVGRRRY